jgi:hypothetical protein
MVRIAEAQARPNYKLWLRFTDGREGVVDLSSIVGRGVFARWQDVAEFEKVSVDRKIGTVCWPGNIDLDPDVLYSEVAGKTLPGASSAA